MIKPAPPCLRRYKAGLSVSIVVNLFLVALIGAHIVRANLQPHFDNPLAQALAKAERSLPPKDALAFRQVITSAAPTFQGAVQRLALDRHAIGQQIVAQPFNPDSVRASLETWRTDWNAFFDAFQGPLVEALGAISPEGRRKMIADRESRQKGMHDSSLDP